MKPPRIYLTHHVDLEIEVDVQNGPGPAERSAYDEALRNELKRVVGDSNIEVSTLVNGARNVFRLSGPVHQLQGAIQRYSEVDHDREQTVQPG